MTIRTWAAAVFLAILNFWINWKILLPGVTPYRESIERGYASFGKLFAANPDYLSWNVLQYCGIPMHYVYLPLLPYLDALVIWLLPQSDPTWLHRAVCGVALLLGPSAICLMTAAMTRDTKWAFWSAMSISLVSPLYWLIGTISGDRGMMTVPWRIQVFIKYGEGPHSVGLFLIPIALLCVWRTARNPSRAALVGAAASLAATVLTNWVAGLALAFCVTALIAVYFQDSEFSVKRIVIAGLIGYGLACFWLTPDFVSQMFFNWPKDAFGYEYKLTERMATAGWAAALLVIWLAFWKFPSQRHLCWLALCTAGFGIPVSLFYRYGIGVLPEARRYALEYEAFLLLLAVEILRQFFTLRWRFARRLMVAAVYVGLLMLTVPVKRFVEHRYEKWTHASQDDTPEYRVVSALQALQPTGRAFLTGGSRLRANSWFPIRQTGGVFESGLKTRVTQDIAYQVVTDLSFTPGKEAVDSIILLRALGVEYVVVHGKQSKEYYRDMKNPGKFDGHLEKVWSEEDDTIFRLPDVTMAHLIRESELPVDTVAVNEFQPWKDYVAAMSDPARPKLNLQWIDARRARVNGGIKAGFNAAFAIPWDPNWHAYQNGVEIPVQASKAGLMFSAKLPADSDSLDLVFEPSLQERVCAGVSIATALFCIGYIARGRRKTCAAS